MAILGFHFLASFIVSLSSLLTILSSNSVIASSDKPFIIAHKKATLKRLKYGSERVIVSIDIYNQGSAGAQVSVSFEVETKAKGKFQGAPALIRYRVPTKADLQAKRLLGKYGSVTSGILTVGLFIYLVASPSSSVKANKKRC